MNAVKAYLSIQDLLQPMSKRVQMNVPEPSEAGTCEIIPRDTLCPVARSAQRLLERVGF